RQEPVAQRHAQLFAVGTHALHGSWLNGSMVWRGASKMHGLVRQRFASAGMVAHDRAAGGSAVGSVANSKAANSSIANSRAADNGPAMAPAADGRVPGGAGPP